MPVSVDRSYTPPPKSRAASQPRPKTSSGPSPEQVRESREDALNGIFGLITVPLMAFNQWADAAAINMYCPAITRETVALADKHEVIANVVDTLAQVGPYAALIAAVTPLVMQVVANHRKGPYDKVSAMGAQDPEILGGQFRMEMQRQQMEMRRRAEAEKAAFMREQAEYEEMLRSTRTEDRQEDLVAA